MSSKKYFSKSWILLFSLVFSLLGCDAKLGETPPPPDSRGFGGTQCLSTAGDVATKYMRGLASVGEVESFWSCTTTAVEDFRRYVRGRTESQYSSQELATFLEKNFLKDDGRKISTELQIEFMKFKMLFVGGSAGYVTRDELKTVVDVFETFRQVTTRLNPYMVVVAQNWRINGSPSMSKDTQFFEEANLELQSAARTIATVVEKNTQTYALSDFSSLMRELAVFMGKNWEFPDSIEKYMPLVKKVKKALAGGDENTISPKEWRRFTLLGARGYVQYLRYYYFIKSVPETGSGYRLSYLARTVDDILSVFQDMVGEKPEGIVTRAEVTDLLLTLKQVWPMFKVSPGLVIEVMKIKQLFFGGSIESLNATDFDTARLKVSRIKVLVERFMPYYSIYEGGWDPGIYALDDARKFFLDSQFTLESTGRELGALFEGAYDLNDFQRLAEEIDALYEPKDTDSSLSQQVQKVLPLLLDAKNMLLGGDDSSLARAHWSPLLSFAARTYSDYLYYQYFLSDRDFNDAMNLASLSVFSNQSLNIIRDILIVKESTQFSRSELRTLVMHLVRLKVLPEAITVNSVDELLKVVLNNILTTPEQRLAGKVPDALNLTSVEVLRQELQVWLDVEIFIAKNFEVLRVTETVSAADLLTSINIALKNDKIPGTLRIGLQELRKVVIGPVPMTVDAVGRLVITNHSLQAYDQKSAHHLNLNRAVSRILVRSLPGDLKRVESYAGINLVETNAAFLAVRKFAVELGILSPSNMTFASSRFREANIFVPHSDGNRLASFEELSDLVGMIFSGVKVHSLLAEDIVRLCLDGSEEVSDTTEVKLSCVRDAYYDAMPRMMTATPEYVRFLKRVKKDEWTYYINNVLKAAGYIPNSRQIARMGDISLAPHVIQYIEMVFARFDLDKNRSIDAREAIKAFPTFKGIIYELAEEELKNGDIGEDELLDIFTFILKYGKPPVTIKDKLLYFFKWKGKSSSWDVWADRTQMSKILGYIADQVTKAQLVESAKKGSRQAPSQQGAAELPSEDSDSSGN